MGGQVLGPEGRRAPGVQVGADLAAPRSRERPQDGRALRPRGHLVGDEVGRPHAVLVEERLQRGQALRVPHLICRRVPSPTTGRRPRCRSPRARPAACALIGPCRCRRRRRASRRGRRRRPRTGRARARRTAWASVARGSPGGAGRRRRGALMAKACARATPVAAEARQHRAQERVPRRVVVPGGEAVHDPAQAQPAVVLVAAHREARPARRPGAPRRWRTRACGQRPYFQSRYAASRRTHMRPGRTRALPQRCRTRRVKPAAAATASVGVPRAAARGGGAASPGRGAAPPPRPARPSRRRATARASITFRKKGTGPTSRVAQLLEEAVRRGREAEARGPRPRCRARSSNSCAPIPRPRRPRFRKTSMPHDDRTSRPPHQRRTGMEAYWPRTCRSSRATQIAGSPAGRRDSPGTATPSAGGWTR